MAKKNTRKRRRSARSQALPIVMAVLIAVLAVVLVILLVSALGGDQNSESSSAPESTPTASSSETTTTTTTATTTGSTAASTTAAPSTTTTVPPSSATAAKTTAAGQSGLITYDTTGRYVQAGSYADPAQIPWNLLLVNDWNALPDNYDSGLSFVGVGRNQKADSRIVKDLQAMMAAGSAYGIGVQSGYRPASQQATLYWRQVNRYKGQGYNDQKAQEIAGTIVKRPGYSEHNSGLAMDLGGSGNFRLEEDFKDTPAYKWLIAHCAEYGFILRYPKDKEAVTGVIYEPWHYRYVGKEAATEIMSRGICLEEYLEEKGQ